MSQAHIILVSEGDSWFLRNRERLGKVDKVSEVIEGLKLNPQCVMEVGCANGWRLEKLEKKYLCRAIGVEPSKVAWLEAKQNGLFVKRSTAEKLPIISKWCDVLIYGFCLYLADPEDWFRIVAEGDRVLKDGGHLIIHDFAHSGAPYRRPYSHRHGLFAYHADFAGLWEANPLYRRVTSMSFGKEVVVALEKRPAKIIEVQE